MRIEFKNSTAVIYRDNGPKIYKESTFWRHVQRTLGPEWIAKLMWRDNHMVAEYQHYARRKDGTIMLWQSDFAIRNVYEDYNREGEVTVLLEK